MTELNSLVNAITQRAYVCSWKCMTCEKNLHRVIQILENPAFSPIALTATCESCHVQRREAMFELLDLSLLLCEECLDLLRSSKDMIITILALQ